MQTPFDATEDALSQLAAVLPDATPENIGLLAWKLARADGDDRLTVSVYVKNRHQDYPFDWAELTYRRSHRGAAWEPIGMHARFDD